MFVGVIVQTNSWGWKRAHWEGGLDCEVLEGWRPPPLLPILVEDQAGWAQSLLVTGVPMLACVIRKGEFPELH